jgi:hypothetical protein
VTLTTVPQHTKITVTLLEGVQTFTPSGLEQKVERNDPLTLYSLIVYCLFIIFDGTIDLDSVYLGHHLAAVREYQYCRAQNCVT